MKSGGKFSYTYSTLDDLTNVLREPLAKMEYAEGRDPDTLAPLTGRVDAVTILLAAKVGPVRLIDNITLGQ
jgi:pantothenate synthetase